MEEVDEHYFGAIVDRVWKRMNDKDAHVRSAAVLCMMGIVVRPFYGDGVHF